MIQNEPQSIHKELLMPLSNNSQQINVRTHLLSASTLYDAYRSVKSQNKNLSNFDIPRVVSICSMLEFSFRTCTSMLAILVKASHLRKPYNDNSYLSFTDKYLNSSDVCTPLDATSQPSWVTLASIVLYGCVLLKWRGLKYDKLGLSASVSRLAVANRVKEQNEMLWRSHVIMHFNIASSLIFLIITAVVPRLFGANQFPSCFNILFMALPIGNIPTALADFGGPYTASSIVTLLFSALLISILIGSLNLSVKAISSLSNHFKMNNKELSRILSGLNIETYKKMQSEFQQFADHHDLKYHECPISKKFGSTGTSDQNSDPAVVIQGLNKDIRTPFLAPDYIEYDLENFKLYVQYIAGNNIPLVSPVSDKQEIELNERDIKLLSELTASSNPAKCKVKPTIRGAGANDDYTEYDEEALLSERGITTQVIELFNQKTYRELELRLVLSGDFKAVIAGQEHKPELKQVNRYNLTSSMFYDKLTVVPSEVGSVDRMQATS